jgi:integral membrane sensor domain MASE1/two-component sensor histidine kinase
MQLNVSADRTPAPAKLVIAQALLLACACFAGAWLTTVLSANAGEGISIWLPNGLVMAIALVTPVRHWPLWAIAAAAADAAGNAIWYQHDWGPAALLITANVGSSLIGAAVVRRFAGGAMLLATLRRAALLLAAALIVMPLVSATLASIALGWSYDAPPFAAWVRIFLGDTTGAMIAAPFALLVLGRAAPRPRLNRSRLFEAAGLAGFFLVTSVMSLASYLPSAAMMLAPMLWAALRFGVHGAVLANALLAVLTCALTVADLSPFAQLYPFAPRGLAALQLYLLAICGSALITGAIFEENRAMLRRLSRSNRELAERDSELAAVLAATEARAEQTASLLAAIGEASPELIFAKDRDGALIYANTATLQVLDIARDPDGSISAHDRNLDAVEAEIIRRNDAHVLASGETVVVEETITLSEGPRVFRATKAPLRDAAGTIVGLAGVCVDITGLIKAAEREKLLAAEIEHRARNLLSVTQTIVQMSQADDVRGLRRAITHRLQALARTQAVVGASLTQGAELRTIVSDELTPYCEVGDGRLQLSGEPVVLNAASAQAVTLVIHELATNAAKYGALSVPTGGLAIGWRLQSRSGPGADLVIEWSESGGPRVSPPDRSGFGSTIIDVLVSADPEGTVAREWRPEGLFVRIVKPLTL